MEQQIKDRSSRIMRLIELIEHINSTIQIHQNDAAPDLFVIGQYEERRTEFLSELAELLRPLGISLKWQDLTNAA